MKQQLETERTFYDNLAENEFVSGDCVYTIETPKAEEKPKIQQEQEETEEQETGGRYEEIINELSNLLNNRVYGAKEKFIGLVKELKNNFGIEISKTFLFGLISNNRTSKKSKQKIRDWLRGVETEKRIKEFSLLDCIKSKKEITAYSFKKGYNPKKYHIGRITKPLKLRNNKSNMVVVDYKNQKGDLRDCGVFVNEAIGLNIEVRYLRVGKEFKSYPKKNLTFIKV